jgi:predicted transcriptional regulator
VDYYVDYNPHQAWRMKTIQMTIEPHLLKAVDRLTRARKTTRSALIRSALEAELRRERVNELEARHAAGYAGQPVLAGEFDAWLDQQDWGR